MELEIKIWTPDISIATLMSLALGPSAGSEWKSMYTSPYTDILGILGHSSRVPMDTNIWGCSRPLHKIA